MTNMTPEEQKIAIAEACGWEKKTYLIESITLDDYEQWITKWVKDGVEFLPNQLPDYLNDLNAMHEAEKILNPKDQIQYANLVFKITISNEDDTTQDGWFMHIHANSAQRCEAFLKTIGKRKD